MKKKAVNIQNGSRDKTYMEVLKKIDNEGICPFCEKNFLKHHPKKIFFKTKYWIATENGWPYKGTKNHFLMVYRPKHICHIEEIPEDAYIDKLRVIKKLTKSGKIKGGTIMMRFGKSNHTGASVEHLHFHIVEPNKKSKDYDKEKGIITRIG